MTLRPGWIRDVLDELALLREVANSGVAFDDERLGYVEVQIDRATWDALRQYAALGVGTEEHD